MISLFNPREREREGGREGGGRGQAACGILIWCVDWEAAGATLLLLNIILDNDNLNRNLPHTLDNILQHLQPLFQLLLH